MGSFFFLLISVAALADDAGQNCSVLLQSIVEATHAERREVGSKALVKPEKWTVGPESLAMKYEAGKLTVMGAKEEVSLSVELTPDQLERVVKFTKAQGQILSPNLNRESFRTALKDAVNYSKLHSAFYRDNANPLEAARELEALINRSTKQHAQVKATVVQAQTQEEFLEGSQKLANALEGVKKLNEQGRLKEAVQEYQQKKESEKGAEVLDRMLQKDPMTSLSQVIETTEGKEKGMNPAAVELKIEYGHDEPRIVHLEKTRSGGLKITPRGLPGLSIKNLRQLVYWLQGQGLDGKSYDWRTYESIE